MIFTSFFGKNEDYIYLDNGASTLALSEVKKEADDFLASYGSLHRGSGRNSILSTERYEKARDTILKSIHGGSDDCVIFTANTTDAINKFTLLHEKRRGVLLSDIEHTANDLPWRRRYHRLYEFSPENFFVTPEQIEQELKDHLDIGIVTLAAASNITGYIIDYAAIYKVCQKYEALLFIDASQLAPHERPDLRHCDIIAYCGHKMYAPFGCGVLAGRKDVLSQIGNSLTGGGNVVYVDPDGNAIYKGAPFVHEAGTPNGVGAITMAKAHEVLYWKIGDERLKEHSKTLLDAMMRKKEDLLDAGYNVHFLNEEYNRTPILIVDNQRKCNQETVHLLSNPLGDFRSVFVREGAFCAYRLLEKIKPELAGISQKISGDRRLNPAYSLIRLSAGLINTPADIEEACEKLIFINKI